MPEVIKHVSQHGYATDGTSELEQQKSWNSTLKRPKIFKRLIQNGTEYVFEILSISR